MGFLVPDIAVLSDIPWFLAEAFPDEVGETLVKLYMYTQTYS